MKEKYELKLNLHKKYRTKISSLIYEAIKKVEFFQINFKNRLENKFLFLQPQLYLLSL